MRFSENRAAALFGFAFWGSPRTFRVPWRSCRIKGGEFGKFCVRFTSIKDPAIEYAGNAAAR
jgi:hypothetical protein